MVQTPSHDFAPVRVADELVSIDRLEPLDGYQAEVLGYIHAALADGTDALEVSGAVADANDALVSRLIGLAENHLGPPPLSYRWLALGSHGRREQVLSSDQDHAIAYAQPPAGQEREVHDYFVSLAGLVVTALARAGLPLCSGGYMATNWSRPLHEFEQMFRSWVEEPQPMALLQAEVFLDIRGCHGDLPTEVLDRILKGGGTRGPFRAQMARAAVTFRPPHLWFGRLRRSSASVDLKIGGAAAIVLLARLYALAAGSDEHSTVPRLRAAASAGELSRAESAGLVDGYRFLTDLRLRHQAEQVEQGLSPDNLVSLAQLSEEQRQRLRETLRVVRDMQDVTAMRFSTRTLM